MSNQIIIIGFMGSGKSTVARALGLRLNSAVVDLDELVIKTERRSPREIIEQDGENRFREIETKLLREVLLEETVPVIAAGGGTWSIAENRQLIDDQQSFTVWLDATFGTCWKRIEATRETRPLARSRQMAEALYQERVSDYALADARIEVTENETPEEIAAAIIREFSREGKKLET